MVAKNLGKEEIKKEVYRCSVCGFCREFYWGDRGVETVCPIRENVEALGGMDTTYAKGKNRIARGVLEGVLDISDPVLLERIYSCTTCGNCKANCPAEVDTPKIVEALRADIVENGYGLDKHLKFWEYTKKEHNPYFEPHADRFSWVPQGTKITEKADVAYYVGCTSAYRRQMIARDTIKILQNAGIEFAILGDDEWCCGSPMIRTGQRSLAEELARHNVEAIEKIGAKKVIASCAGCYKTLKLDYKEYFGIQPRFEVIHSSELLNDLINAGKIEFKKELKEKVTYHDPCHLGRGAGLYDAPREVLRTIPGINFVEMYPTREYALCCGAGGGYKAAYGDWAIKIAGARLKRATETGAGILSSTCPFCHFNLGDAAKKFGISMEIRDITELAAERL